MPDRPPSLALTQGDPAGVGPEILLRVLDAPPEGVQLVLVAEAAALEAAAATIDLATDWRDLVVERFPEAGGEKGSSVVILDPLGASRPISFGESGPADAAGALACLDTGLELARSGKVDALVTAPVSKSSIARYVDTGFRGHTDYLAERCGCERYGVDYLMTFLSAELQVALLTTHLPLGEAIGELAPNSIVDALVCLDRHAGGRIAVAGLNPHAGEGGLLGTEDESIVAPAIAQAQRRGLDVHGPLPADSLFARARSGEFDWVLALYHDQGLIPVKTLSFGTATNWTLGLPILRTSVDHGTAFEIAGKGRADAGPLRQVLETTRSLLAGDLPRRTAL